MCGPRQRERSTVFMLWFGSPAHVDDLAKWLVVIDTQATSAAMAFVARILVAVIGLTTVLLYTSYGAEPSKQTKNRSANASRSEKNPVHLSVRSQADIKQTFTYSPHPSVPDELQGYAGSQVGGTGTYRLTLMPTARSIRSRS